MVIAFILAQRSFVRSIAASGLKGCGMATVEFRAVTKKFDEVVAVDDLSLRLNDGEFMVLVGPSGCGKTTALRMVAGLEQPTSGEIAIGDRVVNDDSPGRPRHRDGVPELRALPAHERRAQHRLRAPRSGKMPRARDRRRGCAR